MFKTLIQILRQKSLMTQALDLTEGAMTKAERLTRAAFAALMEGEKPEFNLYLLDQEINAAEVEVRRMVFQHLAMHPPGDLTPSLILTSIIIDIERIGDYAKNVYEQVDRYKRPFGEGSHFAELRTIRDEVLELFPMVARAVRDGDIALGRKVMGLHAGIGPRTEQIIDQIIAEGGMDDRDAVVLALTARFLKRISAHLSNLASSVVNPFDRIGFRPGEIPPEDADL